MLSYENIEERFLWEKLITNNENFYQDSDIVGILSIETFRLQPETQVIENVVIERTYPYSRIHFAKKRALIAFMIIDALVKTPNYDDENYEIFLNKDKILTGNLDYFEEIGAQIKEDNIVVIKHLNEDFYNVFIYNRLLLITKDNNKNYQLFGLI